MANNNSNEKLIELKDVYAILSDIRDSIKESSKWTKFAGMKEVKPALESKLDNDVKKIIYALSDGKNSSYDIERKIGTVTQRTISNYWQEWEKSGIGEPKASSSKGNRFKASFDLEDFRIKVPELPKQENKHSVSKSTQTEEKPPMEVKSNDR